MVITGIIFIVTAIVLLGFGIVFRNNKGSNLLSGYSTMTAAGKSKFDEKTLLKNTAKLMFLLAILHVVAGVLFMVSLWIVSLIVLLLSYVVLFATGQFATGKNSKI